MDGFSKYGLFKPSMAKQKPKEKIQCSGYKMKSYILIGWFLCICIHQASSTVCKPPEKDDGGHKMEADEELIENGFVGLFTGCALCSKYFVGNSPPSVSVKAERIADIKQICQMYKDTARFASVFDTKLKIPVYSAYQIKSKADFVGIWTPTEDNDRRESATWKYEPKLENEKFPKSMLMISDLTTEAKKLVPSITFKLENVNNQPTSNDYASSRWEIGHLFPKAHNTDVSLINEREATLTFTNAAPQYPGFNKGYWKEMEEIVKTTMKNDVHCGEKNAYFVTGVTPGADDKGHRFLDGNKNDKKKVVIPNLFYTAVCCKRVDASYAFGFYGLNKADPEVKMVRLDNLRSKVNSHLYKMEIKNYFPKNLVLKESKDYCDENADISVDGMEAIKEIHTKLTEMQTKLFEDPSPMVEKNQKV